MPGGSRPPSSVIRRAHHPTLISRGVFFSASLAVGSGVGGGSFFITIFILVLGLDAHHAIPLSKATIFGVAIAAFMVNYFKRHPHAGNRTLIDYDLTVMFEPITLCGTLIGVIMNVLFPNFLVLIPLVLLLSYTTYKTYLKGKTIAAKERVAASKANQESAIKDEIELLTTSAAEDETPIDHNMGAPLIEDDKTADLALAARCKNYGNMIYVQYFKIIYFILIF
jgi:hypothetical protein